MNIEVRPATPEDIEVFAARMRQEDVQECWALCRMSGYEGLLYSYQQAAECSVGLMDDKVFCIFGCNPLTVGSASLWMLFTADVESLPVSFFRKSRQQLNRLLAGYGRLENYVQPKNTFILKWLKWLDFQIGPLEPMGIYGIPVRRFWKEG